MQPPANKLAVLPPLLVLVGASIRAAAQSARRGGFAVVGVDLFGDLDTLAACDQHFLLGPARTSWPSEFFPPHAPVLLVGGLGTSTAPTNTVLFGPRPETIVELKSPRVLGEIARLCGLNVPETISCHDFRACRRLPRDGHWLRKSLQSSGGLGVTWHGNNTPLHRQDSDVADDWVLQRWIAGRAYGASFFVDQHRTSLMGVFRSLFVRRGSRPFIYAGSFGPVDLGRRSAKLLRQIEQLGEALAERFCLRGLFNVDIIVDDAENVWVLEINPRWTAASELIERHLSHLGILDANDSLMRWHVLAHQATASITYPTGNASSTTSPPNWIKRILYADRPGMLDINRLNEIRNRHRIEFLDLPPSMRTHQRGEPVLSMISRLGTSELGQPVVNSDESLSLTQWRQAIRETLELIEPID